MANLSVNIPVPPNNGAGVAVNVGAMGKTKNLIIGGGFKATVNVEYSTNSPSDDQWAPLATFHQSGNLVIDIACNWIRAVTSDYVSGAPNLDVAADDAGTVTVPLLADSSPAAITEFPSFKTVVVPPGWSGTVELSEDAVSWAQLFSFQAASVRGQSRDFLATYARIVPTGPALPVIMCAAGSSSASVAFDPTEAVFMEDYINSSALIVTVAPPPTGSFDILTLPTNINPTYQCGLAQYLLAPPTNPGDAVQTDLFFTAPGGPTDTRASIAIDGCDFTRIIRGSIGEIPAADDNVFYIMGGDIGIFVGGVAAGNLNYNGILGTIGAYLDLGIPVDTAPHTFKIVFRGSDHNADFYVDGILRASAIIMASVFSRYNRMETSEVDVAMSMYVDYDYLQMTGLDR